MTAAPAITPAERAPWTPRGVPAPLLAVTRGQAVAGIGFALFCNAIVRTCVDAVYVRGLATALAMTFNISAVIWVSLALGMGLCAEDRAPLERRDGLALGLALLACLVPTDGVCWTALTLLAAYGIRTSAPDSPLRRGSWILLGVAIPLFWSKMVFFALIDRILSFDAALASTMLGTERVGNTVRFADQSGFLWIAPACSSFANLSLAVLCWMTVLRVRALRVTTARLAWCAAALAGVVLVNVTRIALIGYFPDWFEFLHEGPGAVLASWATIAVVLGICHHGLRPDPAPRA